MLRCGKLAAMYFFFFVFILFLFCMDLYLETSIYSTVVPSSIWIRSITRCHLSDGLFHFEQLATFPFGSCWQWKSTKS